LLLSLEVVCIDLYIKFTQAYIRSPNGVKLWDFDERYL
jgi:hypothetical protein